MAHGVMRLLAVILAVIAAAVFVVQLRRKRTVVNIPAVLFLLIEIVSAESALLHGDNPFGRSVVFLAVVLACTVAPRGLGVHVGVGTACMIVAIASGFTFYIHRDFSVFACTSDSLTSDKCGLFNFNFRGILENERRPRDVSRAGDAVRLRRIWIVGGHGSRCLHPLSRHDDRRSLGYDRRSRDLRRVGHAATATSGSLPPRQCGIACFTSGFRVRCLSASCCRTSPRTQMHTTVVPGCGSGVRDTLHPATLVYGAGMLGWQHVRDSGLIDPTASYSCAQSVAAGSVFRWAHWPAPFFATLGILVWQARPFYGLVIGCVLIPVFMLGVTERPWPIHTSDWLTWAIPAALLSYPAVRRRSIEGDTTSVRQEGDSPSSGLLIRTQDEDPPRLDLARRCGGRQMAMNQAGTGRATICVNGVAGPVCLWHTAVRDRGDARHQHDGDSVASHPDHAQGCGAAIVGDRLLNRSLRFRGQLFEQLALPWLSRGKRLFSLRARHRWRSLTRLSSCTMRCRSATRAPFGCSSSCGIA